MKRPVILTLLLGLALAGTASAEGTPPKPPPKFPMKSNEFRAIVDKSFEDIDAQASTNCTPESRLRMGSLIAQCRALVLTVTSDGVVTYPEGRSVFQVRTQAIRACVPLHPRPAGDDGDD